MALRTAFRADAAAALPAADYEVHIGEVVLRVQVDGAAADHPARPAGFAAGVGRSALAAPGEPDLVIAAGPGIRHVISGELTPGEAIDQDVLPS